jgi:hypothetical protein
MAMVSESGEYLETTSSSSETSLEANKKRTQRANSDESTTKDAKDECTEFTNPVGEEV